MKLNAYSASHLESGQGESMPLNQSVYSDKYYAYKCKSPLVHAYTPCNDTCSYLDQISIE